MSSVLGRFASVDPENAGVDLTNPQSWNGYAYGLNNPMVNIDPSGLCTDGNPDQDGDIISDEAVFDEDGNFIGQTVSCISGPSDLNRSGPLETISPLQTTSMEEAANNSESQVVGQDLNSSVSDDPLGGDFAGALRLVGQNVDAQYQFPGKFAGGA